MTHHRKWTANDWEPQNNYMDHLGQCHGRLGTSSPFQSSNPWLTAEYFDLTAHPLKLTYIYGSSRSTLAKQSKSSLTNFYQYWSLSSLISPMAKLVPLLLLVLFVISMVETKVSNPSKKASTMKILPLHFAYYLDNIFYFSVSCRSWQKKPSTILTV